MTIKPHNEPAFPIPAHGVNYEGMSLRDYFAATALQGLIAYPSDSLDRWGVLAERAYQAADAMLAERVK